MKIILFVSWSIWLWRSISRPFEWWMETFTVSLFSWTVNKKRCVSPEQLLCTSSLRSWRDSLQIIRRVDYFLSSYILIIKRFVYEIHFYGWLRNESYIETIETTLECDWGRKRTQFINVYVANWILLETRYPDRFVAQYISISLGVTWVTGVLVWKKRDEYEMTRKVADFSALTHTGLYSV